MMGLGVPELAIILVIIVIIFGVGKLPEIGGALGKGIKEFKTESSDEQKAIEEGKSKTSSTLNTTATENRERAADLNKDRREVRAEEI